MTVEQVTDELSEPKYDPAIYDAMFRLLASWDEIPRVFETLAEIESTNSPTTD